MRKLRALLRLVASLGVALLAAMHASAQTPSEALLVLAKSDLSLAIVDPVSLRVVGRVPSGPDPHEVIASSDGKRAYISNYGGEGSDQHTISVVDLDTHKNLPAIDLGPLRSAHGLDFAGGKLYFTAETNRVIGRYDPATQRVDWILGTGQGRTHMVAVAKDLAQSLPRMSVQARSASSSEFHRRTAGSALPRRPARWRPSARISSAAGRAAENLGSNQRSFGQRVRRI